LYRRKHPDLKTAGLGTLDHFLRCGHVAVYNWIKSFGESIEGLRSASGVKIVEMDEMHTYIGSKNDCWIWVTIDRNGRRFIHCVLGFRDAETEKGVWETIGKESMEPEKRGN